MRLLLLMTSFALMLGFTAACKSGKQSASPADRVQHDSTLLGDQVVLPATKGLPQFSRFVFGSYCGMCQKNCAPMFLMEWPNQELVILQDQTDSYRSYPRKLVFETPVAEEDRQLLAVQLLGNLPADLVQEKEREKTYGCPDCADGCGVYLEFSLQGEEETKKFWIDPWDRNSVPKDIVAYARTVMETVRKMTRKDD